MKFSNREKLEARVGFLVFSNRTCLAESPSLIDGTLRFEVGQKGSVWLIKFYEMKFGEKFEFDWWKNSGSDWWNCRIKPGRKARISLFYSSNFK